MSDATTSPVRLNLGSGPHCPPGWLHLDNSVGAWLGRHPRLTSALRRLVGTPTWMPSATWGENCRRMNLSRGLDLPAASADHTYTSHFLEHLTRAEGERLLRDCHRVLRPGGRLRILVPDLASVVERYERSRASQDPAAAAQVFHDATGFFDYPFPRHPWALPLWMVRRRHNHSYLHDEASLRAALEAAGFRDVRRRSFGDSDIPGILDVEVESRFEFSFCLEATRP